jgi:transposase
MTKRGRKPIIGTHPIDGNELELQIKQAMKERDLRFLERLYALRELYLGKTRDDAAKLVNRLPVTMMQWIKLWNEGGYESLRPMFELRDTSRVKNPILKAFKNDL